MLNGLCLSLQPSPFCSDKQSALAYELSPPLTSSSNTVRSGDRDRPVISSQIHKHQDNTQRSAPLIVSVIYAIPSSQLEETNTGSCCTESAWDLAIMTAHWLMRWILKHRRKGGQRASFFRNPGEVAISAGSMLHISRPVPRGCPGQKILPTAHSILSPQSKQRMQINTNNQVSKII